MVGPGSTASSSKDVPGQSSRPPVSAVVFVPVPLKKPTFSLGANRGLSPDWSWLKPKTGNLLHLTAAVKTDVVTSLCSLSLDRKTHVGEGAKAANTLGRKICQTCWKRTDTVFQELISELWPALAPEVVIE